MRDRSTAKKTARTSTLAGAPPAPPETRPAPPAPGDKAERMSFTLTGDGKPDFDRMHVRTREKLTAMFQDPAVARSFGAAPVAGDGAPDAIGIPRDVVLYLTASLSQIQAAIIGRITKAPASIVNAIAPWSLDEQKMIAEPLGSVLDKYAGPQLSKYGTEFALLATLGVITDRKLTAIREAMAAHRPIQFPMAAPRVSDHIFPPLQTPTPAEVPAVDIDWSKMQMGNSDAPSVTPPAPAAEA